MRFKAIRFIITGLIASGLVCSCNKTSDDSEEEVVLADVGSSSTIVSSFSLKSNYKLLVGLDSVFFSIDQVNGRIFNADSLPIGTDVRKLQVSIGAPSSASSVEIIMPSLYDGRDTVINYLKNPTDSINFSRGGVMIRINSSNGEHERVYNVNVNVHKIKADSLQWNTTSRALPSTLSPRATAEKSVKFGEKFYCLTRNSGGQAQISVSTNPLSDQWDIKEVTLPADVLIESLTATADALFILGGDKLYKSADGIDWTATESEGWTWVYGAYGDEILGAQGSSWALYPSGASGVIPAAMPVKGTSALWTYTDEWFIDPQAIFVGGITADGKYSGDAWGFDGTGWGCLSSRGSLPAAEGISLFPYFTYRSGNNKFYIITKHSCWIALGGKQANGTLNTKVYTSLDNGVTWREAASNLQLPEAIGPRYGASIILADKTFSAASRAIAPITEWDAPYIILSGGYTAKGVLYNEQWTGVINRLTFKPLQ